MSAASRMEETGRACATARGRHVDDYRNRGIQNLSHHLSSSFEQPARRIQLDEDGFRVNILGVFHPADEILIADGLNRVVEMEDDHLWHGGKGGRRKNKSQRKEEKGDCGVASVAVFHCTC